MTEEEKKALRSKIEREVTSCVERKTLPDIIEFVTDRILFERISGDGISETVKRYEEEKLARTKEIIAMTGRNRNSVENAIMALKVDYDEAKAAAIENRIRADTFRQSLEIVVRHRAD